MGKDSAGWEEASTGISIAMIAMFTGILLAFWGQKFIKTFIITLPAFLFALSTYMIWEKIYEG